MGCHRAFCLQKKVGYEADGIGGGVVDDGGVGCDGAVGGG